jgi:hypothetical protein
MGGKGNYPIIFNRTRHPILFQKCPSIFSGMVELVSFLFNRLNDDLLSLTVAVFIVFG